jgi:putative ABC transport system permease protein
MSWLRLFLAHILAWIRTRQLNDELREEIAGHLAEATDEYLRQGLSPAEARRAALRGFGGVAQVQEAHRDARSFTWPGHVARDVRLAIRGLRRAPGFTAVAILTLALGMGANTAIFSVIDAVILRPLPYANADRLVSLWEAHVTRGRGSISAANLVDYAAARSSFVGFESYAVISRSLTDVGTPEQILGEAVSANIFEVRGVQPAMGRTFLPEEDQPGRDHVVILTDAFWRGRFGAEPNILGRTLRLNGEPYAVIGVMPAAACGCTSDFQTSVQVAFLKPAAYATSVLADHGSHDVAAVGRLKRGVTLAQAQAELDPIMRSLAQRYPGQATGYRALIAPLQDDIVRDVRTSLMVLLGAVGFVLLIACVNVANLLLVRALSQQREFAIRRALGASRSRIIMEITTRALLVSLLGGAAGLACGVWTRDLLVSFAPSAIPRLHPLALNVRVLLVTLGLSLATGLVSGLVSAWPLSREDTADMLKASGSSGSVTRSVLRWRGVLMAAEVAAAVILAVGAGLLIRSLIAVSRVDLGFQTARVLTLRVLLPTTRYPDARARLTFFEALSERMAREPGVAVSAFANRLPLLGGWGGSLSLRTPSGVIEARENGLQAVSPTYFATLGIAILRGRALSSDDRFESMPVAVVNRAFAQQYASGGDVIGWQFTRDNPPIPLVTIVGVVENIRRDGKTASIDPQVYVPAAQLTSYEKNVRLSDVAVKTTGAPAVLIPAIQRAVWALDKGQPITNVRTLDEVVSMSLSERRFDLGLMASFALLAIGLALIGVYGVVAYAATQRSHEIGVRIALGAARGDVVRLLVATGLKWTAVGLGLGLAGAFAAARVMKALLFAVDPVDPSTFAATGLIVCVVAYLACYVPARRAAAIDPLSALRAE